MSEESEQSLSAQKKHTVLDYCTGCLVLFA